MVNTELKEKIIPGIAIFIFGVMTMAVVTFVIDIWPTDNQSIVEPVVEIPPDLMEEGKLHTENGNFGLAIDSYTVAISEDPRNEVAWHEKGKLLNRLNECNDAVLHYERYLENFPDSLRGLEGYEIAKNC